MSRLMSRLPFWAYFLIAIGFLYIAYQDFQATLQDEREKAVALTAAPPAEVDLSHFLRARDVGPADEVVVTGRIDADYNYRLVSKTNGVTTGERFMYVLFGAQDMAGTRTVRAAMVLTEAQKDRFAERLFAFVPPDAGPDLVLRLHGQVRSAGGYSTLAHDALREQNLTRSPEFIFIQPFLDGREAGLAPAAPLELLPKEGLILALVFVLAGVAKRVLRPGPRKAAAAPPRAPATPRSVRPARAAPRAADTAATDAQAAFLPSGLDANSPLMRIRQREAAHRAPPPQIAPQPALSGTPVKSVERSRSRLPRKAALLLVAGALYLGVWQLDMASVDGVMAKFGLPPISPGAGLVVADGGPDAATPAADPVAEGAVAQALDGTAPADTDPEVAARGDLVQPMIAPLADAAERPERRPDAAGIVARTSPRPVPAPRAGAAAPATPTGATVPAGNATLASPMPAAPGGDIVALALPALSLAVAALIVVKLLRLLAGQARPGGLLRRRPDPFDRLAAEARRG